MPQSLLLIIVGVLGLAVGSFLNVVIHRVPRDESLVRPGSHCPRCGNPVRARHNVPVLGWLMLRGRCADCAVRISPRYPLDGFAEARRSCASSSRPAISVSPLENGFWKTTPGGCTVIDDTCGRMLRGK